MKRTILTALMALVLVLSPLAVAATEMGDKRPDPPSAWAQFDVETAMHTGLVPETMQSQYKQNTTRAEFCALAVTLYEKVMGAAIKAEAIEGVTFTDTDDMNVRKMAAVKVVSGVGDGKFDPNGKLTREQAATVLAQLAAALGKAFPGHAPAFVDNTAISAWAQSAVGQVQAAGIMGGVGNNTFSPKGAYTKEQSIVTMLYLFHWAVPTTEGQLYPMSAVVDGRYLWGYADKDGAFVIPPQYAYASEWNGEYGIVSFPNEPEACSVIDRAEDIQDFTDGGEPFDSFPLTIDEGIPSVRFVGNCVVATHYDTSNIYSLSDHKWSGFMHRFISFGDGMFHGSHLRGDSYPYYDYDGNLIFHTFGTGGLFYDGVMFNYNVMSPYGVLFNKQGEVVYKFDFSSKPDFAVSPPDLSAFVSVGDSGIFRNSALDEYEDWGGLKKEGQMFGVLRADGTVILPADYTFVRLTECKQILTGKTGETYRLHDAAGKVIYTFPTYMSGALAYNGNGYYMYKATDGNVVVLSTDGMVTGRIPIANDARHEFISGMIRVTEASGRCAYYTVSGKLID